MEGLESIRRTTHRQDDDLLSAGLGLTGLAGTASAMQDSLRPSAAELRRRAIQMSWKGITDLGPLGGFGRLYGRVPDVPGREYSAFARLEDARQPHRVLCQVPDDFDARTRCLLVVASGGSRGIYGGMAIGGAWGLTHGCAVVYTDKGAGTGYFDCARHTGVALDGRRAEAGAETLEFEPADTGSASGIATKHAHSGDHPEANWGRYVLQAMEFGLQMLNEAYPQLAPFTTSNTRILATGVSNGGGAVLQAAGLDTQGCLDGIVALEPNIHTPHSGRAMFDYATEAALWMPAALADEHFHDVPFARHEGNLLPATHTRLEKLREQGMIGAGNAGAAEAHERLRAAGWSDAALATAASITAFDMWHALGATYASAYLQAAPGELPHGLHFAQTTVAGQDPEAVRHAWWADGNGIPPDLGINMAFATPQGDDPAFASQTALRNLWEHDNPAGCKLRAAVRALAAKLPRKELPIAIVHGAEDGLIPARFTSDAYCDWLTENARSPRYWRLPHVQHFDAFLQIPGFGDHYVPILPYGYRMLDRMFAHVTDGIPFADEPTPQAKPRGSQAMTKSHLDLPVQV